MAYDVIIVGAGAAGLMTAITAARGGAKVLLLDSQKKIGAKILMSGGTRCNVTNKTVSEKDYNSAQIMRVRNILREFDNIQAIRFFKELGVELVLESTDKYFPTTHSGKTVLDALVKECEKHNVEIKNEHKVVALQCTGDEFTVRGSGFEYKSNNVVLTTGGLSYPTSGSDGTGYRIAQSFGHNVLKTMPALTPFLTSDEDLKKLSGISLPVALTLFVHNKKQTHMQDDFLFTHLGFSGPIALDMSRHWLAAQNGPEAKDGHPVLYINFIPTENVDTFEALIGHTQTKHPKKTIKSFLTALLPERLVATLLSKIKVDGGILLNQLTKDARKRLVNACTHYALEISGVVGYSKAEVTSGGIDLSEVDPKSLGSKLKPGLFFAGEILDVDGRIGGFNFQWAWASGHVVGQAIAKNIRKG